MTQGITFANQEQLEKLPIPSLEETCQLYLEALRPLQSAREHAQTVEAVQKFKETSGPALQERLIEYASSRSSYIEQFWYDSYLNFDNPVVLNLNPFFLLEDDSTPYPTSQVSRAAALTTSSLRFVRALRREELPPDTFRNQNLCMYQYSRLFGSARIPTSSGCVMQSYNASKHIAVVCRSQFYWFDVLDDNNDLILSERDIAINFQTIIEDAQTTPITEACKGAVGVLTTENRRVWAGIRDNMMKSDNEDDTTNLECLKKVDWALFLVCLDHNSPENLAELSRNMLCGTSELHKGVQIGTCTNRWYDKLQIIVTKNAKAGVNFEHTGVDGHTVLRFVSDIYTDTILRFAKSINGQSPSLWATASPDPDKRDKSLLRDECVTPRKLEWVQTAELTVAIRFAETRLADLIQQNDFQALEFDGFGMNTIKQMGFSPDAFVQMGFQAAYYSLYGRVECTYEPAMTKRFLHGRTESIRCVTKESTQFVRKFCDEALASSKLEYLKRACERHQKVTARCAQGLGQDRHLYALFCIWKRFEEDCDSDDEETSSASSSSSPPLSSLPSIFADPGWDKLSNVILSTSNCGNPALKLFGFGPTCADGFGIGYIIKPDSITICASSKHRQTRRYLDTLNAYFLEVRKLYNMTNKHDPRLWAPDKIYNSFEASGGGGSGSQGTSGATTPKESRHFGRSLPTPTPLKGGGYGHGHEDQSSYLLGGYGYFDVGDELDGQSQQQLPQQQHQVPPQQQQQQQSTTPNKKGKRRERKEEIGRKLRLAEY